MDIIAKIGLALKKKKEDVILDLYLKDYEHSNYYFALVFNKKIQKFKVLFVPIDLCEKNDKITDYLCYQFIFLNQVEHILKIMNDNENHYCDESIRNRKTDNFDSYYIELNYYNDKNFRYCFKFSQFIEKDFFYLFDIVAILFEYLPNIVSELCVKLLQDFDDKNISVKYNYSFDLDIINGDYNIYFNYSEYYFDAIKFIEKIGSRYYVIYNDDLIVIDYIRGKSIINICSKFKKFGIEHFNVLMAIKNDFEKCFYRVIVNDNLYLCYGFDSGYILLIGNSNILIDDFDSYNINILSYDNDLVSNINSYLNKKYSDNEIDKINKKIFKK